MARHLIGLVGVVHREPDPADEVPGVDRVDALGRARKLRDGAGRCHGRDLHRLRNAQLVSVAARFLTDRPLQLPQEPAEPLVVCGLGVADAALGQKSLNSEVADTDSPVGGELRRLAGVVDVAEGCPDEEPGHESVPFENPGVVDLSAEVLGREGVQIDVA